MHCWGIDLSFLFSLSFVEWSEGFALSEKSFSGWGSSSPWLSLGLLSRCLVTCWLSSSSFVSLGLAIWAFFDSRWLFVHPSPLFVFVIFWHVLFLITDKSLRFTIWLLRILLIHCTQQPCSLSSKISFMPNCALQLSIVSSRFGWNLLWICRLGRWEERGRLLLDRLTQLLQVHRPCFDAG